MKTLRERQMYLQAIQIDHSAPSPPPTVLDHGLYYERLQNLAFLSMHGKYKEVENVLNNKEIVDEKNIYLQPLFRQLKAWIRYISKTEEAEITKKFKQKIASYTAKKTEVAYALYPSKQKIGAIGPNALKTNLEKEYREDCYLGLASSYRLENKLKKSI